MGRGAWQARVYSVTESDTTEATEHTHAHCVFKSSTDNAPCYSLGQSTPPHPNHGYVTALQSFISLARIT